MQMLKMGDSYIKLFRKMKNWGWYTESNTKALFLHFLITANYQNKYWKDVEVKNGQALTGLRRISSETGLSIRQVRTGLERLKKTKEISIQTTSNYSIVSLINWPKYQDSTVEDGFIKLYRSLLYWEHYQDTKTKALFIHLLLSANFTDKKQSSNKLHPGQIITGYEKLSRETGLSIREVRTCLSKLKKSEEVEIEATNKYSLVTLTDWEDRQYSELSSTNERQTSGTVETQSRHSRDAENLTSVFEEDNNSIPGSIELSTSNIELQLADNKRNAIESKEVATHQRHTNDTLTTSERQTTDTEPTHERQGSDKVATTTKEGKKERKEEGKKEKKGIGVIGESRDSPPHFFKDHVNFKFFEEYNELIKTKYPSILAVDQQLSFRDFDKLTNKFTRELLFQQLEPMSVNHKFLQRQSLYRTMTNWLKKEYEAQKLLKWMELWEKFYSRIMPGQEYYWTWKKKIACREIATKVRRSLEVSDKYPEGTVFTDQDVENSFLAFLNKLPEFYQNKKPSPITINQNYNEIVAEIRASDEKRKKHLKNGENKSAATRARETGRRKDFE